MLTWLFASLTGTAAQAADPVIEFYNALLDHYFVTISTAEASGIDSGAAGPGWHRTARVFGAFADAAAAPQDARPVCRFYGDLAAGGPNAHFFTADPAECAAVQSDPGWRYEGIAFHARVPAAGKCPAGTLAVLRNYNGRFAQRDSNHRLTTDRDLHDEMTAIGWRTEGIAMCGEPGIDTPPRAAPVVVSGASPLTQGCDGTNPVGTMYVNSEVEPHLAINPRAPDNMIGVWQQDRWSNGGARGLVTGASFDGGRTWRKTSAAFSRCTGGDAANGNDFARASDPWITFTPEGVAFQSAIAFSRSTFAAAGTGDVAVSRSRDGGVTWETPTVVIRDTDRFTNDKETVTADPTDARYAYVVWGRITPTGEVPVWLARTTNAGDSWEAARPIYDPGSRRSTLNSLIVVLPDGTLVNFFSEFATSEAGATSSQLSVIRSTDKGLTWSARIPIADALAVGSTDPETGGRIRDASGFGQIAADAQGRLFVVWQDARFSDGARDAVAMSRSDDGGLTWSAPARISANPDVAAFIPAIAIARDGTIGVTYYDFRSNSADPSSLAADYWMARSSDGVTWTETRIDGPFDYGFAPIANGLFLGDYQGLAAVGKTFVPFYGRTNAPDLLNRSDVAVAFIGTDAAASSPASLASRGASPPRTYRAPTSGKVHVHPEWAQRVGENLRQSMRARLARRAASPAPH